MPDYAGRPSKRRKKASEKAMDAEEAKLEEQKNSKRRPIRILGVPLLIALAAVLHIVSVLNAIFFLTILLGIVNALLVLIYIWVAYNIFTMRRTAWMMALILNGGMAIFNLFYFVFLGIIVNLLTILILILPSVRREFGR
jgi:cation transport ATPase